jgi:hypothetical protein
MKKQVLIFALICAAAVSAPAETKYDIKQMTPAVKAALDGRKVRYNELKEMKAKGLVGETNRGYVQKLGGGQDVDAVVSAENKDRKAVYQAIVDQNNLGDGALATVEKVFAGVQRDKAEPGEKVQDADGHWN